MTFSKNNHQKQDLGREWGREADSEKIWGEGRRKGEGRERREVKRGRGQREIDGVIVRARQREAERGKEREGRKGSG